MNILIVEDDLLIAEMLKRMLTKLNHSVSCVCTSFEDTIAQLKSNKNIDLVFLDINLEQDKNGIDIGYEIKNNFNIPFVYLTSYSDPKSIKEASKTLPETYLTKPFNQTLLLSALAVIEEKVKEKEKSIVVKDGHKSVKINCKNVLFVKKEKNYLEIYTTTKRYVIRQSIEQFMDCINDQNFVRTHRSYAVQLRGVNEIKNNILFIHSHQIPLSRSYKQNVIDLFNEI